MSNRASIDIGSNSILLLIMDTKTKRILCEESRITSLGRDLDKTGVFHDESMEDSFKALQEYKALCEHHKIPLVDVIVTATEASRVAKNSKDFFESVRLDIGFEVTIITGEAEAYFTALGIAQMSDLSGEFVIIDIGGASTELIHVNKNPFKLIETISLPVGSVRTTDWIKEGVDSPNFDALLENVDLSMYEGKNFVCVAGTMTSLAMVFCGLKEFDASKINDFELNYEELNSKISNFLKLNDDDIRENYKFLGKREKSIKGGARCAQEIMSTIKLKNISFSTYGLRYGTLLMGAIDENYCI